MYRKALIDRLLDTPAGLSELARELETDVGTVARELGHLRRSLAHAPYRLVLERAECRKCGFRFDDNRLRRPGKCPRCRGTWIAEPRVWVEEA